MDNLTHNQDHTMQKLGEEHKAAGDYVSCALLQSGIY